MAWAWCTRRKICAWAATSPLKFVPDNLVGDRKSLDRFEREARAASRLNHPNICTIHDIEDNDGHPFIVMEKLEGESLKQRMQGQAARTGGSAGHRRAGCRGAAKPCMPRASFIATSSQPTSLLPQSGQVKVLDFGLAKLSRDGWPASDETPYEDSLTAVGWFPGRRFTWLRNRRAAKIWIRAATSSPLAWCCTKWPPARSRFTGTNVVTTLDAMLHQKPAPPRSLNPALPVELEGVIGKAMEKDRAERYQTATQIKADLQRLKKQPNRD